MVLLIHSKPSKRFLTLKSYKKPMKLYSICSVLPHFPNLLYYLGPRHTIYPSCDSTQAGSYMFTVASAWKALSLYRFRGRISSPSSFYLKVSFSGKAFLLTAHLQMFLIPLLCLFFSLVLFFSSNVFLFTYFHFFLIPHLGYNLHKAAKFLVYR